MSTRSRLFTTDDWAASELHAAVLAGELMPIGACFASVAEPADERLRAASYAWSVADRRLVAARRSAAWIWGAVSRPPLPHDVAVPYAHRVRNRRPGLTVREVTLPADDLLVVDDATVTTPERTAADLLREPEWTPSLAATICALVDLGLVGVGGIRERLAVLHRAPMVRRAEQRLIRMGF